MIWIEDDGQFLPVSSNSIMDYGEGNVKGV